MKIPLSEYVKTLANREELVGLKVWDKWSRVPYYINRVRHGIWCGIDRTDAVGHLCDISDLSIDLTEQEQ